MAYSVIKKFRDKYTKQIYEPGESFCSEDIDRVLNLQQRGLIGGEIPQDPQAPEEKVSRRGNPGRRKTVTSD